MVLTASISVNPDVSTLTGGVADITIDFSADVTGFKKRDLVLIYRPLPIGPGAFFGDRASETIDLAAAGATLTQDATDPSLYTLDGLAEETAGSGFYSIKFVEDNGITAGSDELDIDGAEGFWATNGSPAPEVFNVSLDGAEGGQQFRDSAVPNIFIAFDEAVTGFDLSEVKLFRNGTRVTLPGTATLQGSGSQYSLTGIDSVTELNGKYELRILPGDIVDGDETGLLSGASIKWKKKELTESTFAPISFGDTVTGSTSGESLEGGTTNDSISGLEGNDTLSGLGGADEIDGGDGNDIIKGKGGSDQLFGGLGDDTVLGGGGNDYIDGEEGTDVLTGGLGNDVFALSGISSNGTIFTADGTDTITDFTVGEDLLDLSVALDNFFVGNGFEAFKDYVVVKQAGANTKIFIDTTGTGAGTDDDLVKVATLLNVNATTLGVKSFTFTDFTGPLVETA